MMEHTFLTHEELVADPGRWRWPNFTPAEVSCHCGAHGARRDGCGVMVISEQLMDFLQGLRWALGVPVRISCAYRCPAHNAQVGGVNGSQHTKGIAADIQATPGLPQNFAVALNAIIGDRGGLGRYPWGWHVDLRGTRARW